MVKKMSMEAVYGFSEKLGKRLCDGCKNSDHEFDEHPCDKCSIRPTNRRDE